MLVKQKLFECPCLFFKNKALLLLERNAWNFLTTQVIHRKKAHNIHRRYRHLRSRAAIHRITEVGFLFWIFIFIFRVARETSHFWHLIGTVSTRAPKRAPRDVPDAPTGRAPGRRGAESAGGQVGPPVVPGAQSAARIAPPRIVPGSDNPGEHFTTPPPPPSDSVLQVLCFWNNQQTA